MGFQYHSGAGHPYWRVHNWLDLRVQARFGRHWSVALSGSSSGAVLLMSHNVNIATIPILVVASFVRLVSFFFLSVYVCAEQPQRVVILKDEQNKNAHGNSAQLACEAVASIRTVASLTREEDCLRLYSESLEEPLKTSNKTTAWTGLLFAFTQSTAFYVIALMFWYGSRLIASLEYSTLSFFVCFMVRRLNYGWPRC